VTNIETNAANELYSLMQIEDLRERMEQFELWQESNLKQLEVAQLVIDRKYLTAEFEGDLVYAMAIKLSEALMDECVEMKVTGNKVTVKITALKRGIVPSR
jgi:hypothetical protein